MPAFPTPLFAREFPDYPAGDMPLLPIGMRDASWHNDSCPSYLGLGVQIFIDYPDPAEREISAGKRFVVTADIEVAGHNEPLFEADDWPSILRFVANQGRGLAEAIGLQFVWVLQGDMTAQAFAEMRRRNAVESDPAVCHSRDFLDPDLAMETAFRYQGIHGENPVVRRGPDGACSPLDAASLLTAAWAAAMPYLRCREEIAVDILWRNKAVERRYFHVTPDIIDCGGARFPGIDCAEGDDIGQMIAYGISDGGFWAADLLGDDNEVIGRWNIVTRPEVAIVAMPTLARTWRLFGCPSAAP